MPTQYVNKATLNGTSTVYWVTTGAPDTTGAQSGYNPLNLTNIAVDYTTSINTATTGAVVTPSAIALRVPTDGYDQMVWTFDESTAPFANSGYGGTNNLVSGGAGFRAGRLGLFGNSLDMPGGNVAYVKDSTAYFPTTPFTISLWVNLRAYGGGGSGVTHLLYKLHYAIGTWTSPYVDIEITLNSSNDGTGYFNINRATAAAIVNWNAPDKLTLGVWHHLGMTWDGTTLSGYIDGNLIGTGTGGSGALQQGPGPWIIGVNPSNAAQEYCPYAIFDDVRMASTVRSASWFQQVYQSGVGLASNLVPVTAASIDLSDTYTNLPSAGTAGRLFLPNNSTSIYRDSGSAWSPYGPLLTLTKPPAAANFTIYQTGSNASLVDDNGGLYFSALQRVTTEDSIFAAQNNPGGTGAAYTLTVGFLPIPGGKNGVGGFYNYHITGIGIYNSTTTQMRDMTVYTDGSGALHFQLAGKTGLTATGATTFDVGGYPLTAGPMIWLRVVDDGTTNRTWYCSTDGRHWKATTIEARTTGFTSQPDKIGLYINPYNADAQMNVISYSLTSP